MSASSSPRRGPAAWLAALAAAVVLLAGLAAGAADPAEPIAVPKLTGRVVDLTGTLGEVERARIASKLADAERLRGAQVAVLLVPTLGTETIEEFATRVTDEWKLGRAGVDDGVLFVIAKQDRRMRIHTGRGVQGVLTDALSKRIVADRVAPRFRTGDFAGGNEAGVDAILQAIAAEALPLPKPGGVSQGFSGASLENFFWLAFFAVPIVGGILRSLLGRFLGASLTSGATGLAAWFLFGSVAFGAIAAIAAFVVVLFMGAGALRAGGGGGGWGSGGWTSGGGGGGSWSGGGGFSGGGGGFDGGGASGGW